MTLLLASAACLFCLSMTTSETAVDSQVYEVACDSGCPEGNTLYDYQILNNGCLLVCVYLGSSSKEFSEYYDFSQTTEHRLTFYKCLDDNHVSSFLLLY